jgi:putative heme-binding domain-containing protein
MERVAALSPDIGVGADLFANNCRLCHAFHGNGAQVGPDLDALSDRSGLNLITQILNPSQSVEEAYIAHDILLKDGSEWLGIITDQTPSRLTLRLSNGQEKTLDPSEVDHVSPASRSLMPDGWGEVLDDQQLASLIAYLQAGAGR